LMSRILVWFLLDSRNEVRALWKEAAFSAGEFVTVRCDVPAGVLLSTADFSIYKNIEDPTDSKNFKAWDGNGAAFAADLITVEILPD